MAAIRMRTLVIAASVAALTASATASAATALVITGAQIKDGTVRTVDLKNGDVRSIDVKDGDLRSVDIANESLRGGDIAADAVSSSELAPNAVTSAEIADGGVTAADEAARPWAMREAVWGISVPSNMQSKTTLTWETDEGSDAFDMIDEQSGEITAPIPGLYQIVAESDLAQGASGARRMMIQQGNSSHSIVFDQVPVGANRGATLRASQLVPLQAGETITVNVTQFSGAPLDITDGLVRIAWIAPLG